MKESDSIFESRLSRVYDELKWLYMELYSNDTHSFDYFISMLKRQFDARSEELREWDDARTIVEEWYRGNDIVGMMLYTDCFAGTLKGVQSHIDYIKECGVNYMHLMPLLKTTPGKSDGGYAVADFGTVDERLGTMDDLSDLSAACHRNGIATCLDFVMNHTSEDHEWAVKAKQGDPEAQARYFFYDNWDIPNQFEKDVPQVFPTTAPGNFSWCPEAGKVVMTTFYPYQWDLNYANPMVFNDMTEAMLNLCNHGIDIIRLDAVPYIWKQLGTNCRNLPQVHTIVRMMRLVTEVVCPGTLLLGEVVMEPDKVVPYFGTPDKPECHMLYNVTTMASTWHTVATKDVRLLEHQLDTIFSIPKDFTFLNYLRCHDDIGWGLDYDYLRQFGVEQVAHKKFLNDFLTGKWPGSPSRGELYNDDPRLGDARLCGTTASLCGIEAAEYEQDDFKLDWTIRRDIMLHAFLLTQTGIPVLYSGDEIGQLNDYSYHEDPYKWDDSRYLHRGAFSWDDAAKRHDPSTRPGRIFTSLQKLLTIRRTHDVFEFPADTWIVPTGSDHILGIGRYFKGEKLIALFNFGDDDGVAWVNDDEEFTDLFTGEKMNGREVPIRCHDFHWLLHTYEPAAPAKKKEPELPAEKKEPELPAKKKEPQVPAEKKEPELPAKKKEPQVPARKKEPQVPAKKKEPELPAKKKEPQVLAKAESPEPVTDPAKDEQPAKEKATKSKSSKNAAMNSAGGTATEKKSPDSKATTKKRSTTSKSKSTARNSSAGNSGAKKRTRSESTSASKKGSSK